jgi:3-hydroxybutyryl-CoA dehydrogenase
MADRVEPVGLVGLGLMGRGIAACLLSRGLEVVAWNRTARRSAEALPHIDEALRELARRRIVTRTAIRGWKRRLHIVDSLAGLAPCRFVIESVKEDLELKRRLYDQVEAAVPARTVISSNTSSLPITVLQAGRKHPDRFIGMHWGEPAQIMRYLEIIPGKATSKRALRLTRQLGEVCGKEPTVLREDIQGFLSNRMMYAMLREACYLVEAGIADVATVDRSFRNDMGWWALLAGPFRWMDLTGIPAYQLVMEGLLPKLRNTTEVPQLMRDMVASGAVGVGNAKGFYRYSKATAQRWEKAWVDFTYDMRRIAEAYSENRIEGRRQLLPGARMSG